jgi:hypothetical protein
MREETREIGRQTVYLRTYDDWPDFVSFAERVERERKGMMFGGMECASATKGQESWYGTSSLAEAIALARRGWPQGRMQMRDIRDKLKIDSLMPTTQRFTTSYDVSGDAPDIGRFLQGEPENMITQQDNLIAQRGKVIRLILSRSGLGYVEAKQMVRRGVAIYLAFETLMKLGYSTQLMIAFSSERGGYLYEQHVPVLYPGDPANLDTLAFMMLQPAVPRRLCFATKECEPMEIRKQLGFYDDGGYAHSCEPVSLPENDLFLNWDKGLLDRDEDIIPFTYDILRRVGIKIDEEKAA